MMRGKSGRHKNVHSHHSNKSNANSRHSAKHTRITSSSSHIQRGLKIAIFSKFWENYKQSWLEQGALFSVSYVMSLRPVLPQLLAVDGISLSWCNALKITSDSSNMVCLKHSSFFIFFRIRICFAFSVAEAIDYIHIS